MTEIRTERDWWALGIALVSLGISILNSFIATLYHRDEVRVVVGQSLAITREKNRLFTPEQVEFTFINSGNRQALITEIYGEMILITGSHAPSECEGPAKSILINALPVVLKPGDIQIVKGKVAAEYPWGKVGDSMQFREDGKVEGAARYVICLQLYVTTPDNSSERWVQALYDISVDDAKTLFDQHAPLVVLSRTHVGL